MSPAAPSSPDDRLDRECTRFARYLTAQHPGPYVLAKYRDAHTRSDGVRAGTEQRFERLLVAVASGHSLGAWLVDAYSAMFHRGALVRRKWVLLLAILETCAPTADYFDEPRDTARPALLGRLAVHGLGFALALLVSVVLFTPLRLVLGGSAGDGA